MRSFLVTLLLISAVGLALSAQTPVVVTKSGKLFGKIGRNRKGGEFYSFEAIPYAEPPVGSLRFKAPVPAKPWKGILNATKSIPECVQVSFGSTPKGTEDCLYLNVYAPKFTNKTTPKVVMVSIHGGGFFGGSSAPTTYGPEFLLTDDVVLATINYRLGFFGFLNSDKEALGIAGNAGLKDQVLALKWIKDNIRHFGGDPRNVTIFGTSAGGASVHLHMLSPMSRGLFQKVIAQSGTALNLWARGSRGNLELLCEALKISTANTSETLKELRSVSAQAILKVQLGYMVTGLLEQWTSGPVIENQRFEEAFLADDPVAIIRSRRHNPAPLMLGYNTQEALFLEIVAKQITGDFVVLEDFGDALPYDLLDAANSQGLEEIAKKVGTFYLDPANLNCSGGRVLQPTVDYFTDTCFLHYIFRTAEEHASLADNPVYFYRFSANTKLNIIKGKELAEYPGAAHGEDILYLHDTLRTPPIVPGSVEDLTIDRMVRLWTNFAKHANPTPERDGVLLGQTWRPHVPGQSKVMDIGNTLGTVDNPDWERIVFWKKIYQQYL